MDRDEVASPGTFRSYLLFWSGQLVSLFGSSTAQFVIIWWITLETESALYLALASLLGLAPTIVLSPIAGVLVDRWNRKILIGTVDFLQALATVVLIFLFSFGVASIWHVLALLALRGIFQAFHVPALSATTPTMVPKNKLSRMNGLAFLFSGAVTLMGPVVAALLLEFWQVSAILWIDAATFIVAVIPLLIIKIPAVRKKHSGLERYSFKKELGEGFSFIRTARGFLPFIAMATALNFLLTPLTTLFPFFVKYDHSGTAPDLAFVMALFQGGVLTGGIVMSLIKGFKKKMTAVFASILFIFVGYALIALTPTGLFWFMAASGFVTAFCAVLVNVSIMTIRQTVVPLEMQGRVTSVMMALGHAAQPLGMILSGAIVGLTGTSNLFLVCVVAGIAVSTYSWFFTDIKNIENNEGDSSEKSIA